MDNESNQIGNGNGNWNEALNYHAQIVQAVNQNDVHGGQADGVQYITIQVLPPVTGEFQIPDIRRCVQYSETNQYYHIKAGPDGKCVIHLTFNNVPQSLENMEQQYITFKLRRTNPSFTRFPINKGN